jgi:hypothetical protein
LPACRAMERACFLSEERKPDRTRARGKTIELMVNNRAAIPERASLRRSAKSSPKEGDGLIGSRSSAESAPLNQAAHLPEGRRPSGWSSPGLTSEEAGPRAIRKPRIRSSDTALPASPRQEVMRTPDTGCRLLVGIRTDPSDLNESALPP